MKMKNPEHCEKEIASLRSQWRRDTVSLQGTEWHGNLKEDHY